MLSPGRRSSNCFWPLSRTILWQRSNRRHVMTYKKNGPALISGDVLHAPTLGLKLRAPTARTSSTTKISAPNAPRKRHNVHTFRM